MAKNKNLQSFETFKMYTLLLGWMAFLSKLGFITVLNTSKLFDETTGDQVGPIFLLIIDIILISIIIYKSSFTYEIVLKMHVLLVILELI